MMKDALKRRRGQGLDIQIILGGEPMGMAEGVERNDEGLDENAELETMGMAPVILDEGEAPVGEEAVEDGEEVMELPPELLQSAGRGRLLNKFKK